MRFIGWNLFFAAWLLVTAFALSHSGPSIFLTCVAALAIAVLAFASRGLPRLRLAMAVVALVLGGAALLMPDLSGLARLNNGLVAALVFALSVIPGRADLAGSRAG
ncbi:hypothetical protein [Anaeromyxobacter dehalogenans]|uniref:Uncharacterized protein n=1 Tax=Anaeromyxobacter dehalogenans (strain 2CP-C) TaxID=290397 RepID=Q2IDS4_ANADE|nr:hypothetical protein [Anaeromyxobacter dehalogenans]ABC82731.1 hypothetical protein Adeh_2961 [Anaeromyxobacter dehalogenans 2CP-C]